MGRTRSKWVAKHTLGEHVEVPPRILRVVEDGVGDRPGKAPGPQGLELLSDMANDRHEAPGRVETLLIEVWSHAGVAFESSING